MSSTRVRREFARMLASSEMLDLDVDDIREINYFDADSEHSATGVEVILKDGSSRLFQGEDLPEALEILNHWTPPTA